MQVHRAGLVTAAFQEGKAILAETECLDDRAQEDHQASTVMTVTQGGQDETATVVGQACLEERENQVCSSVVDACTVN